jgi:NTP pyrophosphatase (non-canonical NTP hydrolase)
VTDRVDELMQALREFARERDWEQFHTPKNLAMAMIVEAAELVEHFQWCTPEESAQLSDELREAVGFEMADVFIYLLRLADRLEIDLVEAAQRKMALNAERYPVAASRGRAGRPRAE